MNSVGIDISKGKSMVTIMRPLGEVVAPPFEVRHTDSELGDLAKLLKNLDGETRIVMEATGNYHTPVACALNDAGFFVAAINPMLIKHFGNDEDLRKAKTDKKDSIKLASYGLEKWQKLKRYIPEEDVRFLLKSCYRQYQHYSKIQTTLRIRYDDSKQNALFAT